MVLIARSLFGNWPEGSSNFECELSVERVIFLELFAELNDALMRLVLRSEFALIPEVDIRS